MNLLSWDGLENLPYLPNLCFSKICKPGINAIPTGYHRSIHFSQSAVGFMNRCGRTIPFSSAHTSWPQLICPKEDMWLNWASELSQSVWALTFKAPKLSVTLFSFVLTRNIMGAGVWGERTNQLCREEELRRATMESWVPDFSFSCRFKFVSMRISLYHYNKMFFLFKLIGVGLLSLGIQCLNK